LFDGILKTPEKGWQARNAPLFLGNFPSRSDAFHPVNLACLSFLFGVWRWLERVACAWFADNKKCYARMHCSQNTPRVGHAIVFGVFDNPASWWDKRKAGHLGFQVKDSSRAFAARFPDNGQYPAADDAATLYQGERSGSHYS